MFKGVVFLISTMFFISGCGGGSSSTQSESSTSATTDVSSKSPVDQATAGAISGVIKFSGKKPSGKTIKMGADAYCKGQHTQAVASEEVVVNPDGTLKNVYVFVKSGLGDLQFPTSPEPAVLDQKGCIYIPHVLSVQAGQEIIIRNSDGVLHNVNARPKKNKGFNIGQPVKGMETKKSFAKAELGIPLKCDVHPWMRSYVSVQNHPYGAVSSDNGSFTLDNLPPGTYEIEAWHEAFGTQSQKVTLGPKESKSISFTFKGA